MDRIEPLLNDLMPTLLVIAGQPNAHVLAERQIDDCLAKLGQLINSRSWSSSATVRRRKWLWPLQPPQEPSGRLWLSTQPLRSTLLP